MNILISVIIPVYNVEKYIKPCVDSVLAKSYTNMEIILVNDGSTDFSGQVCDECAVKYPDIIKVVHQKNQGLSMARNNGLAIAQGEYVFFVDSDDTVKEGAIALLTDKLIEHGYPDMLLFNYDNYNPNSGYNIGRRLNTITFNKIINPSQTKDIYLWTHSACIRVTKKKIHIDNNILFPQGMLFEDMATTPRLLLFCKTAVCIEDVLYFYTQRDGSIMHQEKFDFFKKFIPVMDYLIDWFVQNNAYDTYKNELCYYTYNYLLYSSAISIIKVNISNNKSILDDLVAYTDKKFPDWTKNPYLKTLSAKTRFTLFMLKHKQYTLLHLLWKLKPSN